MQGLQKDVVLIINPSLWYRPMYPSGILYLAAYLRAAGISCTIIDAGISEKIISERKRQAAVVDAVIKIKPKVIGLSASHIELGEVVELRKALNDALPDVKVIAGGSQPTYRPDDFLDRGFNFICQGEGEKTLLSFVQQVLAEKSDWKSVDGLIWKNGGEKVVNRPRDLMTEEELNALPIPAYDLIDKRYFKANAGIIRGLPLRGAMILTTRGCPYNCTFCGCNLIFGRKVRSKSIESIEAEVAFLKKQYHVEGVWIIDDTFTVRKEQVTGVSSILRKYGMVWGCQSRVNTISEELIRFMKECGCRQLDFGVESGSQRVLDDVIRKGTKIEQVIRAFDLSRKYRIRTLANFMIGLPSETISEFEMTRKLADRIKADVYIFSIATPLPGTPLYDMVGEHITPEDYCRLNWAGSELTKKLNKSEIKDLVIARNQLHKRYFLASLVKSVFSFDNIIFFFTAGSKLEKIACLFRYVWRAIMMVANRFPGTRLLRTK